MPILSGFLPIPLAMMIPFMGAQSLVLGKAFGEGFQYGKRKISAMTNEEFNKLTPSDIAANSRKELQDMIPSMKASITDMRDFQSFIVHELIATAKQLPDDIFQGVTGASPDSDIGRAASATVNAFLPQAFGDTGPEQTQKFADDYEREADRLPFKLLDSIVGKLFNKQLPNVPIEKRVGYINSWKKRRPVKSTKTTEQAIEETSTGLVKQIATAFNTVNSYLNGYHKARLRARKSSSGSVKKQQNAFARGMLKFFFKNAKKYNQLVTLNRKPGLQIDTAKSLIANKMIKK